MQRATAFVTGLLVAASLVACDKDPVEQGDDPLLTLSADSVVVNVSASASVSATVLPADAPFQFASRNQSVATVNASGLITGVAAGTTYIVATLSTRADIGDSVRVRVQAQQQAPSPDSVFVAAVRAHIESLTSTNQFSGAVLVLRNGQKLFEGAYGLANREQNIANTPLTQFRVGSMNKMMTAVAVMQLVQAGQVSLNQRLSTYLPDYPNADVTARVVPHHLLTHTGGTGDIFGALYNERRLELRTTQDYINLYGERDLRFAPGAMFEYSNYGFLLLGAIIERVSGASYYDHLAARVLAPAGMTATGFTPEETVVPGRAVGYTRQLTPGALVSNASLLPYRGTSAGGGYSTVGDLARFAAAVSERRLLDSANTTLLLAGKVANTPKYAYGFVDHMIGNRRFVGHNGGAAGMSGDLMFEPEGGYVVAVLSNFDPPSAILVSNFILPRLP